MQGYRFFAFGGAASHDISDGILEQEEKRRIRLYYKLDKDFRIRNRNWWEAEMPSEEEMRHGMEILEKYHYDVDFVLSHCCTLRAASLCSEEKFTEDTLTRYFDQLLENGLQFKAWLFGHYHGNKKVMEKYFLLYEQIIRLI
ncbi:MAG: hypothetical protein Q4F21_07460 [Lachnospiraceae bacterium]|nr:hypothetical protein [Lachnospiraceae bacterium]